MHGKFMVDFYSGIPDIGDSGYYPEQFETFRGFELMYVQVLSQGTYCYFLYGNDIARYFFFDDSNYTFYDALIDGEFLVSSHVVVEKLDRYALALTLNTDKLVSGMWYSDNELDKMSEFQLAEVFLTEGYRYEQSLGQYVSIANDENLDNFKKSKIQYPRTCLLKTRVLYNGKWSDLNSEKPFVTSMRNDVLLMDDLNNVNYPDTKILRFSMIKDDYNLTVIQYYPENLYKILNVLGKIKYAEED